jgi:hypothetical protein
LGTTEREGTEESTPNARHGRQLRGLRVVWGETIMKYRVWGTAMVSVFVDVEAPTAREAQNIARELPSEDIAGDGVNADEWRPGKWQLHDGSALDVRRNVEATEHG